MACYIDILKRDNGRLVIRFHSGTAQSMPYRNFKKPLILQLKLTTLACIQSEQ